MTNTCRICGEPTERKHCFSCEKDIQSSMASIFQSMYRVALAGLREEQNNFNRSKSEKGRADRG